MRQLTHFYLTDVNVLHWTRDLELATLSNRFSAASFLPTDFKLIDESKNKMTFRRTQAIQLLVPNTSSREEIVSSTLGPETYTAARDSFAHHQLQAAELSNQPDFLSNQRKNEIEQSIEVTERVPFRSELHYMLLNEFNHIEVTSMEELLIQSIEELTCRRLY